MQYSWTPTGPGIGVFKPSLPFRAHSVIIQSGVNWVQVEDTPTVIPFTSGTIWELTTPTANPQITITPPPQGNVPLGPPLNTILIFRDDDLTPNPGIVAPSAPINTQSGVILPGGFVAFFAGLARALLIGIVTNGVNSAAEWSAVIAGSGFSGTFLTTNMDPNVVYSFCMGQGTISEAAFTNLILPQPTITASLPQQTFLTNFAGANNIWYEARFVY
jgi:hypothetical protein